MSRYLEYLQANQRRGRAASQPSASMSQSFKHLEAQLDIIASSMSDPEVTGPILGEGAKLIREAVKALIPVYGKTVKRYRNGKVIATYHPGNLRRSVQILNLEKTSAKFVGYVVQPRGKGSGTFATDKKVDGYYARFVEIKQSPLRRGSDASSGQAMSVMRTKFMQLIARYNAGN